MPHAARTVRHPGLVSAVPVTFTFKEPPGERGRLPAEAVTSDGEPVTRLADLVLVLAGSGPRVAGNRRGIRSFPDVALFPPGEDLGCSGPDFLRSTAFDNAKGGGVKDGGGRPASGAGFE